MIELEWPRSPDRPRGFGILENILGIAAPEGLGIDPAPKGQNSLAPARERWIVVDCDEVPQGWHNPCELNSLAMRCCPQMHDQFISAII